MGTDSRAAHGLPPHVNDPDALAKIASIIRNAREAAAANGDPSKTDPGTGRTDNGTARRGVKDAA